MYQKIMVPLDGSELAECVLPHVRAFIEGFNVRDVIFVRVVETDESPSLDERLVDPKYLDLEEKMRSAAVAYLNRIRERFEQGATTVHLGVFVGRVAEKLVDCAEQRDVDLIIMATHGRSGISRWFMGSIAEKLLRSAKVPVFMVRAPGAKGRR
jgi:nucleotide-binding universal stress UspA family protein